MRQLLLAIVACSIAASTAALFPMTVAAAGGLTSATNQELARARRATAQYHDVAQALADGYVQEEYAPGEGFEYVNEALIDCTFDLELPEVLHYIPSGDGLRLVGVEYVVLDFCPTEGFAGDADEWSGEAGLPILRLNAWIWFANPNGMFEETHPHIP